MNQIVFSLLLVLSFGLIIPSFAAPLISGSPIVDKPSANPFTLVGQDKLQTVAGVKDTNTNADLTSTLSSAGFSSASSFQTLLGTDTTSGMMKDLSTSGGLTPAMLTAAQAGNTKLMRSVSVGADLSATLLGAGYATTTIKLRYNVSFSETLSPLGLTPPIVISTPVIAGRMAPEAINKGTLPTQVNNYFVSKSAKDVSSVLATTLNPVRMYPLGVTAGNGLKVEWPCGIDVLTGADTCCGLAASNIIFHVQKGIGLGDDLDVAGSGDASVLDQSGTPVTLVTDTDALARLILCSSTSAMDTIVAGSSKISAQGIPAK